MFGTKAGITIGLLFLLFLPFYQSRADIITVGNFTTSTGSIYHYELDLATTWVRGMEHPMSMSFVVDSLGPNVTKLYDISFWTGIPLDQNYTIAYALGGGIIDNNGDSLSIDFTVSPDSTFPDTYSVPVSSTFKENSTIGNDPETSNPVQYVANITITGTINDCPNNLLTKESSTTTPPQTNSTQVISSDTNTSLDYDNYSNDKDQSKISLNRICYGPEVNSPLDSAFEKDEIDHSISWIAYDDNPQNFTIVDQDNNVILNDVWTNGIPIILPLSNLEIGDYNYTIVVHDEDNLSASDSVIVQVRTMDTSIETTSTSSLSSTTDTATKSEDSLPISNYMVFSAFVTLIIRKYSKRSR